MAILKKKKKTAQYCYGIIMAKRTQMPSGFPHVRHTQSLDTKAQFQGHYRLVWSIRPSSGFNLVLFIASRQG